MADRFQDDELEEPEAAKSDIQMTPAARMGDRRFVVAPLPSAAAPVIFFDAVPYFAHNPGYGGSLTATTQRQTSDDAGIIAEDRVIVALLKAPLPALLQLRDNINAIEDAENKRLAALYVAATEMPPGGLAH